MSYSSKNLILFVRAVCILWTMIFVFMFCYGCFKVSSPELTIDSYKYSKYQSNTNYLNNLADKELERTQKLTEAQLTDLRLQLYEQEIKMEKRDGIQGIITSLIGGSIGVLMYFLTIPLLKIKCSDQ